MQIPSIFISRWTLFGILVLLSNSSLAELADLVAKVKPSVVAIGTFTPSGSPPDLFRGTGFVVGNGNQIVTNAHVLPTSMNDKKLEKLAVYSGQGRKIRRNIARIVKIDRRHDLALLSIDNRLPALALGSAAKVREGDSIVLTGFPIGMVLGLYPVTHQGIVAAISPVAIPQINSKYLTKDVVRARKDPYKVLQLDATAYPGNSGSPVYERNSGKVIGVVNSVLVKNTKESALTNPTGITYAIPVRFVKDLLGSQR